MFASAIETCSFPVLDGDNFYKLKGNIGSGGSIADERAIVLLMVYSVDEMDQNRFIVRKHIFCFFLWENVEFLCA